MVCFQEEQSRLGMIRVHVDKFSLKEKEAWLIIAVLKTGDFEAVKRVRIMEKQGAGLCKLHFSVVSYNLRERQLDSQLKYEVTRLKIDSWYSAFS